MNTLSVKNDVITIDGERYYLYTHNGKYTSTKFISWDGIHYYNAADS